MSWRTCSIDGKSHYLYGKLNLYVKNLRQHLRNSVFDVRMLDESAMYVIIDTFTRDWKLSPMSEPSTHDFETTIHTR